MHISFEKTAKLLLDIVVNFLSIPPTCGFEGCLLLGRYVLVLFYKFPCGTPYILVFQRNKCILDIKCRTLLLTFGIYLLNYHFSASTSFAIRPWRAKKDSNLQLVTLFKRCGATQRISTF